MPTSKSDTPATSGDIKQSKQYIIEAAVKCFERYGPQRTSMDDIAEAAGISRKTLYRMFDSRPMLVQSVLQSRFAETSKKTQARIAKATSFEEALLEGSVTAISEVRKDTLANEIILKSTDHTLEQFLIRGNDRTYKANLDTWKASIDKGRAEGVIKPNLSDSRIIDIIASIYALLAIRDDSLSEQRAFIKDVLLPAIIITKTN